MIAPLHPLVQAAAAGTLPEWSVVTATRRQHAARVSALMRAWATELNLGPENLDRWAAAGLLHDVLRDEDPAVLRSDVPEHLQVEDGSTYHGPAAAARLQREGVEDDALLLAIAHHTLGHPELDRMGLSLCAADFLEPGRTRLPRLRKKLRKRMPNKVQKVARRIFRYRMTESLRANRRLPPDTVALWNRLTHG